MRALYVSQLSNSLERAVGDYAIVWIANRFILGDHSEPQPDIALLRPRDDFYKRLHPLPEDVMFVVKVVESSLRYDREIKIPLYPRYGIPKAWLVNLTNNQLTIFRRPTAGAYEDIFPHRIAKSAA
jgi:Uma2 family endonuclease